MQTAWLLLASLACPIGMMAVGGVAWAGAKALGDPAPRTTRFAARACCGPRSASRVGQKRSDGHDRGRKSSSAATGARHTFVFADLAGFTALTETHGDERAADLAGQFGDAVRALLGQYGAEEIKSLGDGIMLRVDDPAQAVRLGVRLVREVGGRRGFPLVRVGVHTGPAVTRDGDWFGATVNVAARVTSIADGGEVLVTEAVREAAAGIDGVELGELSEVTLKHISRPVTVYLARPAGEQPSQRPAQADRPAETGAAGSPARALAGTAGSYAPAG